MEDLELLLGRTNQKVDVHFEHLVEGEYVRAYRSDLGARTTVVSGLINGVTFSLEVPEYLDDDATVAVALSTIEAIRESVFLDPGVGPDRFTGRAPGQRDGSTT